MNRRVPLAFSILIHNKKRLAVAIASISFASILMFQQQGYKHALYDSSSEIVRLMEGDLIVFSEARFALSSEQRFPRSTLDQVAGLQTVERAIPIYLENSVARLRAMPERPSDNATSKASRWGRETLNRVFHKARPIRVIGIPLADNPFRFELPPDRLQRLQAPRTALLDRLSKRQYGFDLSPQANQESQFAELSGRRVSIIGLFQLGQDFAHDGNMLMGQDNFANYFPYRARNPLSVVDLGIIRGRDHVAPADLKRDVAAQLPVGTTVLTREEFIQRESDFWAKSTPIGMIFTVGAVMGFVVGVIICYQILVDDISNQIGEYATLKAMGYTNLFLCRVVVSQAAMLSIASFIPSLIVTYASFQLTYLAIGLRMELSLPRVVLVLSLTFGMCIFSSLLAIRRLIAADPASLFR